MRSFDVLVVGGGHAGCEAAAAAARMGANTALVTLRLGDIGVLSCNPAIGGLGKGHLVREIDALDGLIGRVGDVAAIQHRLLNRSKGPAVQGPRAQLDRKLYAAAMRRAIADQQGLEVIEASVDSFIIKPDGRVAGVNTLLGPIAATSVVLTTGTFLGATLHHGLSTMPGGRFGGAASNRLSATVLGLGLPMTRFKTGTPPRLDGRTIDWSRMEMQYGDASPVYLSDAGFVAERRAPLPCAVTRSNPAAHEIIRQNIALVPMYAGKIDGIGPRYCPSIEDKVMRFGDRDGHQIYLEPEGFDDPLVYPNGISTSLPANVQAEFIAAIYGLERAKIVRPGYAVEYGVVDPRVLAPTLALRDRPGLFLAGQINGTTGYEEAAGQGIVAGINAARAAAQLSPMIFDRASSYLGVMIDDLVTQGVSEPYRMFTSRAEYRLSLRIDNAGERLTPVGIAIGVVGAARRDRFVARNEAIEAARRLVSKLGATPNRVACAGIAVNLDGRSRTAAEWLTHTDVDWAAATKVWPELADVPSAIADTIATDMKYAIYLDRQATSIAKFRADGGLSLPEDIDFASIAGLSSEMVDRLTAARPTTIGAATRIPGVTPSALTALLSYSRRAA
nr:tRNA uridine-5-carboxymethylaminomethyl(34) synthesis enzyme MnmG [Polymorphobacter sp.]